MTPDINAALQMLRDAGYEITVTPPKRTTIANSDLKPGNTFVLNRTGKRYMTLDRLTAYNEVLYWNTEDNHSTTLDGRCEITEENL